ncbi:PREDICTED: ankyrin repeat domain-containing protein 17-like isoform X2 [Nicrophorus vespilloides]|uniref:Ankyrin repeat domain-containing protein 17-like isoform X2 n=1 Tax=Nicrophorus vespilloides TaxID=110193 RepID=A0ABM1N4S1_NICVS|nr:PREDICTED: ankyrin repeat domain-containing protein 17-like isoform X2 [Nicrophorus vespilloides]
MQNVAQGTAADNPKIDKVNSQVVQQQHQQQRQQQQQRDNLPSTPIVNHQSSAASSPTETYSEHRQFMSDTSESEEDSVSEVESFVIDQEYEEDPQVEAEKFLLSQENRSVDPETQARLEALLQAAGISQLATKDGKHLADPEVLRRLTSSVSSALDEAAAALTRMRSDTSTHVQLAASAAAAAAAAVVASKQQQLQQLQQQQQQQEQTLTIEDQEEQEQQQQEPEESASSQPQPTPQAQPVVVEKTLSLVEACTDGDVGTVRKLLTEGRSVHETSEDGESLLSLACSAGYYELAQVLLAMHANVEDRGIKGECTPLMEAASAGHLDIVKLLVAHGADVNAQSTSGNTPLMYGCAGGHQDVVRFLLGNGASVEDHNENGHTPLMEAASAGHVGLAMILLENGAGINTHSNEFKESALTLACYKGHLEMVKFLLEAGADQEHKTDEMHTALMEASMDGHVEVARLLLDSGAQVNMPTDSFESPLTLAACGGHVDLAMLLIERGANIEEVNDEGYTPLMEAAREGHEDMVALLLSQGNLQTNTDYNTLQQNIIILGANINAQTDETQETALTLACCGGFTEVADFLIKAGADIELGASTPLMEAAQEGHLELVKYLLENSANVHAQTQTGDTALTYACENGHTDVADLLLQYGADLEHESEGGRTPLMKACRAGHLCTVQFLISKGANVRRQTTNNDHTPLSLACAGGHLPVVELLLAHRADPNHKLKDNSTMLIEAAKGGHTNVVQLLLDYPHSMMLNHQPTAVVAAAAAAAASSTAATNLSMLPGQVGSRDSLTSINLFNPASDFSPAVLQEVPEAVRIISQMDVQNAAAAAAAAAYASTSTTTTTIINSVATTTSVSPNISTTATTTTATGQRKCSRPSPAGTSANTVSTVAVPVSTPAAVAPVSSITNIFEGDSGGNSASGGSSLTSAEAQQDPENFGENRKSILAYVKNRKKNIPSTSGEGSSQKKQLILEELHRVDREFHGKQQTHNNMLFQYGLNVPQDDPVAAAASSAAATATTLPPSPPLNIDIAGMQQKAGAFSGSNAFYTSTACLQQTPIKLAADSFAPPSSNNANQQQAFYFAPLTSSSTVGTSSNASTVTQPIKFQTSPPHAEVSQNTAISDRPKVKPVSKKEGKNLRKLYNPQQVFIPPPQQQQQQQQQVEKIQETLQGLDLDNLDQEPFVLKEEDATSAANQDSMLTASILQQFHSSPQQGVIRAEFVPTQVPGTSDPKNAQQLQQRKTDVEFDHVIKEATKLMERRAKFMREDEDVKNLECYTINDVTEQQNNLQVNPYSASLDENMIATLAIQQDLKDMTGDVSRVEYFAVPNNGAQLPVQQSFETYEHLLQVGNRGYQAGFQAGISLMQRTLACPNAASPSTTEAIAAPPPPPPPVTSSQAASPSCTHSLVQTTTHHCEVPCSQHSVAVAAPTSTQNPTNVATVQQPQVSHQVQAATQTVADKKNKSTVVQENLKKKGGRLVFRHQPTSSNNVAPVVNNNQQQPFQNNQNYQIDPNSAITQYGSTAASQYANAVVSTATAASPSVPPVNFCMDVDSETESNHDTALTLACAGGHEELVELLIARGSNIEHRDKKGFTPLILAATAGHEKVVEILIKNGAEIEAQSERTKDTPLSLACSGGRYEVVEILLNKSANKEHRNVSDYTPLSLAASGGYVNIIKLLLNHGAEINSRTGSKLGISPLMLAAMNGHTSAVKLLLDMGSDINAQIETNRNTALTLACFQGRHEVVSLLLDRKANVEHRAKTGLTPLMEAASGGYVEVGRVLLDKGAEVNATPVPSSRDTALTIAADKGHVRFVELLLCRGAAVEVKNKKGNSPLWLAANGGHLNVVELLYNLSADIDSQDNRKVSCLMAAFRKGHTKVVKWMVSHVSQFPSDQEMIRYISTVSDKELLEKCQECVKIIRAAKETQAAKANKNASILLEELDMEKNREESKKAAAARRRERKKKKKLEKKEEKRKLTEENKKNEDYDEKNDEDLDKAADDDDTVQENNVSPIMNGGGESAADKEEGDSGIDANSQGSCSSNDVKTNQKRKDKKKKKGQAAAAQSTSRGSAAGSSSSSIQKADTKTEEKRNRDAAETSSKTESSSKGNKVAQARKGLVFDSSTRSPAERDDFEATGDSFVSAKSSGSSKKEDLQSSSSKLNSSTSPKQAGKQREDGWKEVVRKSSVQTVATSSGSESGVKKVSVPLNAISRVIGRGGSNINAIRGATGAHIEVEKQSKGQGERIITIKGTTEATRQAHSLIAILIRDPDVDILQMLPKTNKVPSSVSTSLWDKTQIGTKKVAGKVMTSQAVSSTVTTSCITVVTTASQQKSMLLSPFAPCRFKTTTITSRATPTAAAACSAPTPRLPASGSVPQPEKIAVPSSSSVYQRNIVTAAANSSTTTTTTTTRSTGVKTSSQTFAAKLTEINQNSQLLVSVSSSSSNSKSRLMPQQQQTSPQNQPSNQSSPKHHHSRPTPTSSAPPNMQHYPTSNKPFSASVLPTSNDLVISQPCSPTPLLQSSCVHSHDPETIQTTTVTTTQVYSLFNTLTQQPTWKNEAQKPANFATVTGGSSQNKYADDEPQVDASKAPGYRGTAVCSPVSSKTSSNSTTPPNLPNYYGDSKGPLPPIGSNLSHNRPQANNSSNDVPHYFPSNNHLSDSSHFKSNYSESAPILADSTPLLQAFQGNSMQQHLNFSQQQQQQPPVSISRLNPKAPDFSSSMHMSKNQMYNGYQNSYPPPIAKPMLNYHRRELPPQPQPPPPQTQGNNNWAMLQMPFSHQHNDIMTGMAGLTLQHIVRATEAMMENGAGDMGNNSPAMSPNLPPAHQLLMNENHYLEDRNKPQPIGTERARKSSFNPSGSGNASTPTNDASSWMNNQWSRTNLEPFLGRNSSLYNEDIHIIDSTLQHGIPPMEPNFNMNMSRQFYYPQSQQQQQQQQQPPQQQMSAVASVAGATGIQHDFPSDLKSDLATWEARQNMAELQDKQRRWSNMNNRWNP